MPKEWSYFRDSGSGMPSKPSKTYTNVKTGMIQHHEEESPANYLIRVKYLCVAVAS